MNTGNYIINKFLIDNLDITKETEIRRSPACDVIYFNTLLFEQLDLHLHVVPGLSYSHVIHPGSVYLNTYQLFPEFNQQVQTRYDQLFTVSNRIRNKKRNRENKLFAVWCDGRVNSVR